MTDTYSITYNSRVLNGLDSTSGLTFNYLGDQGFGLAPLHRITTRGPLQHGDSDIDFRLDPRILQIPLLVKNESASPKFNAYTIREKILQIFRPQTPGILNVSSSNGTTTINRMIGTRVLGGLTFDVDPVDYHVRTVVQLRADDPTWFDPTSESVTYTQTDFGATNDVTGVGGNWYTYPEIRVTGPVTNFTITSVNQSQVISMTTGFTIPASTTYYFDLRYGYKTVYTGPNQTGTNVIANVSVTSDLATWSLLSNPGGITNAPILFTGTGTDANTRVRLQWNDRYTGI
jgi:hypothetical protein